MNELALFAGAGGGILGGHLLGWRTVCAVEINPYARQVLLARQADGCLPRFPIWDDITTFDGTPWRGHVDIVSGGFPCQDISAAGKGAGITGERSGLWSQMARIISEVRPSYVWVENSPLLVDRGLAVVLGDLAKMGYDARWGVVGAHHAGAPHRRDRIWILGYAQGERDTWGKIHCRDNHTTLARGAADLPIAADKASNDVANAKGTRVDREYGDNLAAQTKARQCSSQPHSSSQVEGSVAYSASVRGEAGVSGQKSRQEGVSGESLDDSAGWQGQRSWWGSEPNVGGVVDGVASGMDIHGVHAGLDVGRVAEGIPDRAKRLHAIGNGQVPAALVLAWHLLTGE